MGHRRSSRAASPVPRLVRRKRRASRRFNSRRAASSSRVVQLIPDRVDTRGGSASAAAGSIASSTLTIHLPRSPHAPPEVAPGDSPNAIVGRTPDRTVLDARVPRPADSGRRAYESGHRLQGENNPVKAGPASSRRTGRGPRRHRNRWGSRFRGAVGQGRGGNDPKRRDGLVSALSPAGKVAHPPVRPPARTCESAATAKRRVPAATR